MKRAVFLHGTDGSPEDHWWPLLKQVFEDSGYEVWAPLLPDNDRPSDETYWKFLSSGDWDFTDNVIVGHSSGATEVLNLLAKDDFPRVKAAILAGTFLNEDLTSKSVDFEQAGQFENLFPDRFKWDVIKQKADKFYFVHGDDDPYCLYDDAVAAARQLSARMITVLKGGHLTASVGVTKLPELTEVLRADKVL